MALTTDSSMVLEVQVSNQDPAYGSDTYFRQQRYRHTITAPEFTGEGSTPPPTEGQIWPRGNLVQGE